MRWALALVVAGCAALLLVATAGGARPAYIDLVEFVRVAKPAFPRPAIGRQSAGGLHLRRESVMTHSPMDARPPKAPRPEFAELVGKLVGAPFVRSFAQPGTTFGLYGTGIVVAFGPKGGMKYAFDLRSFGFPPRALAPRPYGPQEIAWARQLGRLLVVQTNHLGYAKDSGGRNGYLTGIDLDTGTVRWRSPSLVANARNFVVTRGMIVSGYGFTAEKDWLYLLDPRTGRVRDRLALPSMAEWITVRAGRLVVRCYDALVVARLTAP